MIEVRDRKNSERLLGTLATTPALPEGHRYINFAVTPAAVSWWREEFNPSATVQIHRLTFEVKWRYSAGGWRQDAFLVTDDPLDQLMLHRDFLLPGEDERAADDRRYSAALFRDPRRKAPV